MLFENARIKLAPYFFVSPFFILFGLFGLLPLVLSLAMSLVSWNGLTPGSFSGVHNYSRLLHDTTFHQVLWNTAVIWLQTPLTIGIALLLAELLNTAAGRLRGLYRGLLFSPVIVSLVVSGLMFALLLDPKFGLVNRGLTSIGLHPINWLGSEAWTKPSVILVTVWRWTGYNMVILLAGLQSVPTALYDAAKVDGANHWQRFRWITIPMIQPVLLFVFVIGTVGTIGNFEQIFAMFGSSGGVGQSAMNVGLYIYNQAFQFGDFGYAAAISWVVALIILGLVSIQFRLFRDRT